MLFLLISSFLVFDPAPKIGMVSCLSVLGGISQHRPEGFTDEHLSTLSNLVLRLSSSPRDPHVEITLSEAEALRVLEANARQGRLPALSSVLFEDDLTLTSSKNSLPEFESVLYRLGIWNAYHRRVLEIKFKAPGDEALWDLLPTPINEEPLYLEHQKQRQIFRDVQNRVLRQMTDVSIDAHLADRLSQSGNGLSIEEFSLLYPIYLEALKASQSQPALALRALTMSLLEAAGSRGDFVDGERARQLSQKLYVYFNPTGSRLTKVTSGWSGKKLERLNRLKSKIKAARLFGPIPEWDSENEAALRDLRAVLGRQEFNGSRLELAQWLGDSEIPNHALASYIDNSVQFAPNSIGNRLVKSAVILGIVTGSLSIGSHLAHEAGYQSFPNLVEQRDLILQWIESLRR